MSGRELLSMAAMDPAAAFARALELLEDGDDVLALRVAGLAAKELGRLDEASPSSTAPWVWPRTMRRRRCG